MNGAIAARWRRLRPLAVVILIAVAVPPIVSIAGVDHHREHVYPKRSVDGRRARNLVYERSYQYEATFEKCEIQSIDTLAATLGVPPTPTAVARAYAAKHEPAVREVTFRGCRDAYTEHWAPPSD